MPAPPSPSLPLVGQDSDGGALEVKQGGLATFMVPVEFAANSVGKGYSGGAVHVDGTVRPWTAANLGTTPPPTITATNAVNVSIIVLLC